MQDTNPQILNRIQTDNLSIICLTSAENSKYSIWGYLLVFVLLLLDFKYYDYVQQ